MQGITKTFPGIVANDNVTLNVRKGRFWRSSGRTGGKVHLMSILFGAYSADSGTIKIHGKEEHIKNPNVATDLGIGMVHQHFKLVQNYTVTQNIVLGMEPTRHGILDLASAEKKVAKLSEYMD
jgi:simple sugar transport system ATP-binding protein